jgi:hypothetical protein
MRLIGRYPRLFRPSKEMENFHNLLGPAVFCLCRKCAAGLYRANLRQRRWSVGQHCGGGHATQVVNERVEIIVAKPDPIHIDHRHGESGSAEQLRQRRRFDPWMSAGDDPALGAAGFDQAGAKRGQAVAASDGADQRRIRLERTADQLQG